MQAHYISSHVAQDGSPQFLDVPWVDINIETRASAILAVFSPLQPLFTALLLDM